MEGGRGAGVDGRGGVGGVEGGLLGRVGVGGGGGGVVGGGGYGLQGLLIVLGGEGVNGGVIDLLGLGGVLALLLGRRLVGLMGSLGGEGGGGEGEAGEHVKPLLHAQHDEGQLGIVDEEPHSLVPVLGHGAVQLAHDLIELVGGHRIDSVGDGVQRRRAPGGGLARGGGALRAGEGGEGGARS